MIPRCWIAGVVVAISTAAHAVGAAPQEERLIVLSCDGVMVSDGGETETPIFASGTFDLEAKRASGFGIGAVPINYPGDDEIRFGTPRTADMDTGQLVEGSYRPETGRTSIVVRSARRVSEVLIRMDLVCRTRPPAS